MFHDPSQVAEMLGLFSRKKSNTLFGVLVPQGVERDDARTGAGWRPLESKSAQVLLVAVGGASEAEMLANLSVVIDLAAETGRWIVCSLSSNLVVMVEQGVLTDGEAQTPAVTLAQSFASRLKMQVKSLGGPRMVAWGEYGSPSRRTLGPFLPDFLLLVSRLERQAFGTHGSINER
jgi:hypothetical protein